MPDPLPCEAYCHSLTDPSILSARLRDAGAQTLTVFGLHTPHSVFGDTEGLAERLTAAVLASLNSVLAEPIQDVLWTDAQSKPCIETTTTLDLQRTLGMTGGNIFHGALSWPFADNDDPLDTPARQWGVATDHERIMLCGSGARRGGRCRASAVTTPRWQCWLAWRADAKAPNTCRFRGFCVCSPAYRASMVT